MEKIWSRSNPSSTREVYSPLMQGQQKDRNCKVHIHINEQGANIEKYCHYSENACSVWSTLLYGCETWAISDMMNNLEEKEGNQ